MKKILLQVLSFVLIGSFPIVTQAQMNGSCGLSAEDAQIIMQRMEANRNNPSLSFRSAEPIYVPMKYHFIVNKKGDIALNRVDKVIESICRLNEDYGAIGMIFYLKGVEESILTSLNDRGYEDPKHILAASIFKTIKRKHNDAVNVFITNDIGSDDQGGQVLGYYTPNGDYIVMRKSEIAYRKSTLAHELGHFFTLPHPFFGWEVTSYDITKPTPKFVIYNNQQVRVEYVDQDKKINGKKICELAADKICDTRANYKLGYGHSGCQYSGKAVDPDGVLLEPTLQEENYMGYFLSCTDYFFTPEQGKVIEASYNSTDRQYLHQNYSPITDPPGEVTIYEPLDNVKLAHFDYIVLDWKTVENAQLYKVEIARNKSFSKNYEFILTSESRAEFAELRTNNTYYWRVTPINETHFCENPSPTIQFRTGEWNTATKNIDGLDDWYISKNPVSNKEDITLVFNSSKVLDLDLSIINLSGKSVYKSKISLIKDNNQILIHNNMPVGTYIVHLKTKSGISSKKLTIIK